jgi:hypothetical protein
VPSESRNWCSAGQHRTLTAVLTGGCPPESGTVDGWLLLPFAGITGVPPANSWALLH